MRRIISVALAFLLLALAMPASGEENGGTNAHGACKSESFGNDDFSLRFHGKKGFFNVINNMTSGGGYDYKTLAVTELDGNGNNVSFAKLSNSNAQASTCSAVEEGGNLTLTLTSEEGVAENGGAKCGKGKSAGCATITFVYHYNETDNAAKFDLFVAGWPWADGAAEDNHTLAFDFGLMAKGGDTMEAAENGIGFQNATGVHSAYMEWAPNATVTYENGTDALAIVNSTIDMASNNQSATVRLIFEEVEAGYVALDYDPVVGVGFYLIVAGIIITDPTRLGLIEDAMELVETVLASI